MCARYTLTAEHKEILKNNPLKLTGDYQPDANIAITDTGLVITADEPVIIQSMYFGLIPHNATSRKLSYDTWNIRSETVMEKPTFRSLLAHHKTCLIIADSFYEWKDIDGDKQPYRFVTERSTFCFAGLWSQWIDPITKAQIRTFGIMTTEANETVAEVHAKKRMPVILPRNLELKWLNQNLSPLELLEFCKPYPDNLMNKYRVSNKVNAVSKKDKPNKGIDLTKPLNTDEDKDLFS